MIITMIAAMDEQGVIGLNNDLPWKISADLQHFRKITMGKPIVMGRNTHESIGRALPGRKNIVVTHQPDYRADGCHVVSNVEAAILSVANTEEVMIMGGASIYQQLLPKADRLYITRVHTKTDGDTWFPTIDWKEWQLISRERHAADEKNQYAYSFEAYKRH